MAPSALLFDIEGTLCDTRRWYVDLFVQTFGVERGVVVRALAKGIPPTLLAGELGIARSAFLHAGKEMAGELAPYPGVITTLRTVRELRVPAGVVTNLPPRLADLILQGLGLGGYFGAVVTWQRGVRPKPHPAPIQRALRMLGIPPSENAYYVGDSEGDAEAALAAGIRFAWAEYGYGASAPPGTFVSLKRFAAVLSLSREVDAT